MKEITAHLQYEKFGFCFAHSVEKWNAEISKSKNTFVNPGTPQKTIPKIFNKQGTDLWQQESNL
jgi:hypothetical protein